MFVYSMFLCCFADAGLVVVGRGRVDVPWLRTNGVSTARAAAKVMNFDRLRKKGTPWQFWEDKSRLTGYPKGPSAEKKHKICSDPISADPICPFPNAAAPPAARPRPPSPRRPAGPARSTAIYLRIYLSIHLSIYRSIYLSIYLCIYLSLCIYIYIHVHTHICAYTYISCISYVSYYVGGTSQVPKPRSGIETHTIC